MFSNLFSQSLGLGLLFCSQVKNLVIAKIMDQSLIQEEDRPWLALPYHSNKDKGCSMSFQSVSSNKVHHCDLPACAGGKNICGSSSGFLIMVDETSEITMIDPNTNARFVLPQISTSLAPKHSTDIDSGEQGRRLLMPRGPPQFFFLHIIL